MSKFRLWRLTEPEFTPLPYKCAGQGVMLALHSLHTTKAVKSQMIALEKL